MFSFNLVNKRYLFLNSYFQRSLFSLTWVHFCTRNFLLKSKLEQILLQQSFFPPGCCLDETLKIPVGRNSSDWDFQTHLRKTDDPEREAAAESVKAFKDVDKSNRCLNFNQWSPLHVGAWSWKKENWRTRVNIKISSSFCLTASVIWFILGFASWPQMRGNCYSQINNLFECGSQ